ncbi:ethyl tert-butyl ether degradation protein EthD [Virgibacillus profundi]|uniref:Ethyl tert-butyl ether degradation protein EthD n=1 Tax=Virgibacillus profundi TaxID=2024555 RepID=A0A2A2ICU7_9BACI|nr:EthD family reductase [Virgibacillus profundi]PAV28903.1 ethyl tert-butyl ether degradation protein EthD [Virgibacillus profundi]PXY53071.1 EthD family reductase [Virgibacillus profundi]
MVKLIALYKQPEDPAKFDEHYFNVHTPITKKIPGLKDMKVTKVVGSPMGKSDYYLLCEMFYDTHESLQKAMKTDEGKASGKDVMQFAGDIVTLMIGEEVDD